jgi:hypothetical protein
MKKCIFIALESCNQLSIVISIICICKTSSIRVFEAAHWLHPAQWRHLEERESLRDIAMPSED